MNGTDEDPPSDRPEWRALVDLPPVIVGDLKLAEARVEIVRPHVATLPDGSRINLPAGTVLREGVDEEAAALDHASPLTAMRFAKDWARVAREEEREACKKIAKDYGGPEGDSLTVSEWIAEAIRARGGQ